MAIRKEEEQKKNGMKIVDNMDGMKNATEKLNVKMVYLRVSYIPPTIIFLLTSLTKVILVHLLGYNQQIFYKNKL